MLSRCVRQCLRHRTLHAIVLTVFRSSLLQNPLEEMGCMGRAGRREQHAACISVQEARRASTLKRRRVRCGGCGGGDRTACLLSLRTLVCVRMFGAYASCPMCVWPTRAVGWSAVVMVGSTARGVQHVCTGEQRRGMMSAHVE
jgi:hypothetical protein